MKNKIFTIIRTLISFSFVGLLIWFVRDKIPTIITTIKEADKGFLIWGFLLYIFASAVVAIRLSKVIAVQSIKISYKEAIYLTFIGYFFNNFLPTSFGGDFVKAYYAGKKSNKKTAAFAAVFMDRFLALIPFTLMPAFTITFFRHRIENKALIPVVYLIFFGSLLLLWFILHKNTAKYISFILKPFKGNIWHKKISDGYNFINIYSRHRLVFLWNFLLSVTVQILSVVSTYFFSRAVGVGYVNIGIFFIFVPLVCILTLIPSLNGLGIREGGFIYFLKDYMPVEKALAISILVLATVTALGIIGSIIYSFNKRQFAFKAEG